MAKAYMERIEALRQQYLNTRVDMDVYNAKYVTEGFKETEGQPWILQKATGYARTCEKKQIYIQDHELLVGGVGFKPRAGILNPDSASGVIEKEVDTISTRPFDPFYLSEEGKKIYLEEVKDYWKNKCVLDRWRLMAPKDMETLRTNGIIFIDRKAVRKVLRRALAVRQECDRACDRKQHTRLLKGVFALPEYGGRSAAIEKRIADRAVAYAASFERADARNSGDGARRAGREQHRVCVALAVRRLDRKAGVGVLDARDLGAVKLCAEAFRLRPPARQQLRARNHIGEAEIVFDFVGLSECAVVLVQHMNVKTCAHRIDRGAESGGTAADDNQCGHGASFTFRYPRGIPAGRPAAYG